MIMAEETWLTRLKKAVDADPRSMRAISMAAGLGVNYLSETFSQAKEPGVEKIIKVCDVLNVSFTYIITGVEFDADDEKFFRVLRELPASERKTLIDLAHSLRKGAPS